MANRSETSKAEYLKRFLLCAAYIAVSTTLIRFNKFLMAKDRFPYSMVLTAIHMSASSLLCTGLYLVWPALFPAMENTRGRRLLIFKWFVPIGFAYAISLYASNEAYVYCSVTFLQFMKEGNVIISFLMSCAVGLQVMNRLRMAVILWVIVGASLAVSGEVHLVFVGFVFQLISQLAECSKAVMGEYVLSGGNLKLDPMSYTMFAAPACLSMLLIGNYFMWESEVPHALERWWPVLIPNALLAFVLNVLVAAIIKEVSAVGFILAGVVKDIVVVLFSAVVAGEVVTPIQLLAFGATLSGIFFWSYMKVSPDDAYVIGAERLLGMPNRSKEPNETTALRPAAKEP